MTSTGKKRLIVSLLFLSFCQVQVVLITGFPALITLLLRSLVVFGSRAVPSESPEKVWNTTESEKEKKCSKQKPQQRNRFGSRGCLLVQGHHPLSAFSIHALEPHSTW